MLDHLSIHPYIIFHSSGAWSPWQQAEQGVSDIPLTLHYTTHWQHTNLSYTSTERNNINNISICTSSLFHKYCLPCRQTCQITCVSLLYSNSLWWWLKALTCWTIKMGLFQTGLGSSLNNITYNNNNTCSWLISNSYLFYTLMLDWIHSVLAFPSD